MESVAGIKNTVLIPDGNGELIRKMGTLIFLLGWPFWVAWLVFLSDRLREGSSSTDGSSPQILAHPAPAEAFWIRKDLI
jgi:hypothetical protein